MRACVGETRFATQFIMVERLLLVQSSLEQLVADQHWKKWASKSKFRSRAAAVEKMVHSKSFWASVNNLVKMLE